MKSKPILLALFLASLSACHSAQADNDVEYHQGPWATDEIQNASMNNAIVAQHTLYLRGGPASLATGERTKHSLGVAASLLFRLAAHTGGAAFPGWLWVSVCARLRESGTAGPGWRS